MSGLFWSAVWDWFTVAVWTTSSPAYAAEVVAALFAPTERARLAFVWASDRCTRAYDAECALHYWRKNLSKVRRRRQWPLESIIVIDDTPRNWERSYGNLVRVQPFAGEQADDELPRLLAYLDKLRQVENVRAVEKRHWRQHSHQAGQEQP